MINVDLNKTNHINKLWQRGVILFATILSGVSIIYCFVNDYIIRYGDAESHLNIAKRVIDGFTPGFAQLGGIWLPLPHLFMLPLVYFDPLWRSGLAGSIISGTAFVVSAYFIYKLVFLISKNHLAAVIGALAFMLNPNVLYMQSTPMTELLLIMFFVLSSFHFIRYIKDDENIVTLLLAAFFGFCAVLTRYDGWFLVFIQALIIGLKYLPNSKLWRKLEGQFILYCTLAGFGVLIWLMWGYLILGDPLYFTNSIYSAASQQQAFLASGQLPSYHNFISASLYYVTTAMLNAGVLTFVLSIIGMFWYLFSKKEHGRFFIMLLLTVPFMFYIVSLYFGQSVIFIPQLTPASFDWHLFNVRYGLMAIPFAAVFVGYLFYRFKLWGKILMVIILSSQLVIFGTGQAKVISFEDGISGLSAAKRPDAESWLNKNYDGGLIVVDDYSRTISIIRSHIPMQNLIQVGTGKYWNESLVAPEKYAEWIVAQKGDAVWKALLENTDSEKRLYKYFNKVYTSPDILIFKKIR